MTMYSNLRDILNYLSNNNRLVRVKSPVDPKFELAGIAARFEGTDKAVLFENVRGSTIPVLMGLYWSRSLLAELYETTGLELPHFVSGKIRQWKETPREHEWLPPSEAPVLANTPEVNLPALPIPTHAEKDGGPYIDAGVVVAKDPETGILNASIQRFQVIDETTLHVNIDAGRHLEQYLQKAAQQKATLKFSLNIGVPPGVHFAAAAPSEVAPIDTDELGIASEFQSSPLRLTNGSDQSITILADSMLVLECEMTPGELGDEGPFAEVTGYYAEKAPRPKVRVTAIHHQDDPVFHSILSGQEVFNSVGILGESSLTEQVSKQVPGIKEIALTNGGCGFYHAVVQMKQVRKGWSKQAVLATMAAFPPLKMVTVVDDDVDLRNSAEVEWAMATRLDPKTGIIRIDETFGHGLNPSFPNYLGSKIGFDATRSFPFKNKHERITYRDVDTSKFDIQ